MNPVIKDKLALAATVLAITFVICYGVVALSKGGTRSARSGPVFDVPAMVGKDISGVLSTANAQCARADPDALKNMKPEFPSYDLEFTKDGHKLSVSFVPASGQVQDFFIESDEADGAQADLAPLRAAANLDALPPGCTVTPVPATSQPGEYTGITVTPP